ncbi:conserved hypothetical protein [Chthoniobacter flavus Ellin428]|uniref:Uncharacterized protein n=2 Tax=Chthoniobacter flavus TaxID=191863 RepID=B4D4W6_9BACT|nr:conserved hypothetical protein [Chthoniobacter flavus Ellin428]
MHPVDCPRCGASFSVPVIGASEQAKIATAFRRSRGRIEAIRVLRELTGIDLRDAKGTLMHVTTTPNTCHRCGGPLDGSIETTCPLCKSLNLDWPDDSTVP